MKNQLVERFTKKDIFQSLKALYGRRFSLYRKQWGLSTQGKFVSKFPLGVNFELIDACNLKCIHCIRSYFPTSRGRLGFKLFKKVVDECSLYGCPSLKFGFGEPFLEKDIFKMSRYAKDKGIMDFIVTTNGTLITENMIDEILNSGITFLRVSLDAATQEVYSEIRKSDLGKAERILKRLITVRNQRKLALPIVRVSFVMMDKNRHEKDAFLQKWNDWADFVDFQYFVNPLPEDVESVKSDFFCPYPFQMIAIMANGDIRACCAWYGKDLIIGNLKNTTVIKAWNSELMSFLREQSHNKIYKGTCAKCVKARAGAAD